MGQTESRVPRRETFCPLAVLCLKSNTGPGVMGSKSEEYRARAHDAENARCGTPLARDGRAIKKPPAEAGAQVSGSLRHMRGGGASKRSCGSTLPSSQGSGALLASIHPHACTSRCILPRLRADVSVHVARAVHEFHIGRGDILHFSSYILAFNAVWVVPIVNQIRL